MTAERNARMTELFVAVGDALERSPVPTYGVQMPEGRRLSRPFYLPAVPQQTRAQYSVALAKLGKLGIVKQN